MKNILYVVYCVLISYISCFYTLLSSYSDFLYENLLVHIAASVSFISEIYFDGLNRYKNEYIRKSLNNNIFCMLLSVMT